MALPAYVKTPQHLLDLMRHEFDRRGIMFSKAMASKMVGGECRLERLVKSGEVRMEKPTAAQNGKWFCNGGDVIRHMNL